MRAWRWTARCRSPRPGRTSCRRRSRRCHAAAPRPEDTDWPQIATLYTALAAARPSPVVELNRAVAIAMADGPDAGLRAARRAGGRTWTATTCSTPRAPTCCGAPATRRRPTAPTGERSSWSPTTRSAATWNDGDGRSPRRRRSPVRQGRGLASVAAMLFPTVDFALFFCLVFLGHWVLNHNARAWKWFMIGASYFFYAYWDARFVVAAARGHRDLPAGGDRGGAPRSAEPAHAGRWRSASRPRSLPSLFFKYYGFFAVNVTNRLRALGLPPSPPLIQVVLPVGISFFTFMAISYVVDVYHRRFTLASLDRRHRCTCRSSRTWWPDRSCGPSELIPQLDVRRDARHVDVVGAGWLILGGLFKKVVIASFLATAIVDPVFSEPARHGWQEILVGIVAYAVADLLRLQRLHRHRDRHREAARVPVPAELRPALQRPLDPGLLAPLAHDAVALAARLPLHPARWEPKGTARTYGNLMITMLLGGLWHGAAWTSWSGADCTGSTS